ncbi:hypothetical protein ABFX02_09G065800 [Erythranthe guttata]|uniref:J protein JJJ2-like n=1 Tax=Erythranthe guttata TaxID=4155 RepID=UPI00064DCEB1|nr:PREDICTED: J protein JJJ2-like [Erythranthe guttata]|eukprot:XP_012854551.1 PREDICTED: J protein JJJ2-like [Erythranthe guttata]
MEYSYIDQAIVAKRIAEKKLSEMNITEAKNYAFLARELFPDLDGLSQLLMTIHIHLTYETKINGQIDYYGIFGAGPFVDEQFLKSQYKKMALSLHPDKNKLVGAEGAFKILQEAWEVVSDNCKRTAYDAKLMNRGESVNGNCNSDPIYKDTTETYPERTMPCQQKNKGGGSSSNAPAVSASCLENIHSENTYVEMLLKNMADNTHEGQDMELKHLIEGVKFRARMMISLASLEEL